MWREVTFPNVKQQHDSFVANVYILDVEVRQTWPY